MSGIEVVGLVLGALPLVISGLEHYAEGAATIKRIWFAAQAFRELARRLKGESVVFRNTLSILLNDCVDIETQKRLMEDVGGDNWCDPDIVDALNRRLQESRSSYLEHVQSIANSLEELKKRLYIGANGKVPFEETMTFRQAYERFRFALKKSAYEELIKAINDDNNLLNRLTEQSKILYTGRVSRLIPDFDKIRLNATSVFESLQRGLHATCQMSHKASLFLKPAGPSSQSAGRSNKKEETFRIVLHHQLMGSKGKVPQWSMEEAEVRLISAVSTAPDVTQAVAGAEHHSSKKRNVTFQEPTPSTTATLQSQGPEAALVEIKDLCRSIAACGARQCGVCLGYLSSSTPNSSRHAVYWPEKRLLEQNVVSVMSLGDALKGNACRLTNADAHRLGVSLATGILRLHDTPWMTTHWNKADITLVTQQGKIQAEHPFISATIGSMAASTAISMPMPGKKSLASLCIRNQTLFTLGLVLIELCLEKPIDELHLPEELNDDGTKNDLSDFQAADRLIKSEEISNKFGFRWNEVVRRCVYCDLNQAKPDLSNLDFRKAVYNDILAELEEDHRLFFGL